MQVDQHMERPEAGGELPQTAVGRVGGATTIISGKHGGSNAHPSFGGEGWEEQ
jgi:hypothetical protein